MKFKKFLNEKYFARLFDYEIFINPTSSDIKDLKKAGTEYVRFLVDPKKKVVYMWDEDLIHADVIQKLFNRDFYDSLTDYLPGTAALKRGKPFMIGSDEIEASFTYYTSRRSRKFLDGWYWLYKNPNKINWANKYVDIKGWIPEFQRLYDNYLKYKEKENEI